MRRFWRMVGSLAALASWVPASARADSSPADEAIQRGVALRRDHKDADALAEFRHAYALDGSARALAQIALAEASLEQWVDAERDLTRSLASEDPWVERQRPVLKLTLKEIDDHLGTLQVLAPPGADLRLDGDGYGAAGPFMRVPAKHLVLEIRAAGFEPDRREIDVPPNEVVRVSVALERARVAADSPRSPSPLAPIAVAPPTMKTARVGAWVASGVAAFFSVTGVAFAAYAADRAVHYNNNDECGDAPGSPRSTRCAGYASQFQVAQAAELISFTLAGASAATAVVLFLLHPRGEAGHARVRLVPTTGGASLVAAF